MKLQIRDNFDVEAERARFEANYRLQPHVVNMGYDKTKGKYLLPEDDIHWRAWLANAEQNTSQADIKLEPCPFCGGEAYAIRGDRLTRMEEMVSCLDCFAEMNGGGAISRWNTRVGKKQGDQ